MQFTNQYTTVYVDVEYKTDAEHMYERIEYKTMNSTSLRFIFDVFIHIISKLKYKIHFFVFHKNRHILYSFGNISFSEFSFEIALENSIES